MNSNQDLIIKMLSSVIKNSAITLDVSDYEWSELLNIANRHQITALLYPVIKKLNNDGIAIDTNVLDTWKRICVESAIRQKIWIKGFEDVLENLAKANISVILLKGIILRELYPNPDMRTMSDVDILVKEDELDVVTMVLLELGYKKVSANYKHTFYYHPQRIAIEVHTKLSSDYESDKVKAWEMSLWSNLITINICKQNVYTLSYEDHLLYLCVHLVNHTKSLGFGLRQLCDLILYIETYQSFITWDQFLNKAEIIGINKFATILFTVCNELFNLEANILKQLHNNDDENLKEFITDILSGGVFGKEESDRVINGYYFSKFNDKSKIISSKINHVFNIMFPPYSVMRQRYPYIEKTPVLLPVAWIHRALRNTLRRDKLFPKASNLQAITNSYDAYIRRYKLLEWLDLI